MNTEPVVKVNELPFLRGHPSVGFMSDTSLGSSRSNDIS